MKRHVLFFVLFIFSTFALTAQTPFSQENATRLLHHIGNTIGARPMGSPAEQEALRFAVEKFMEYGCDTAYIMPMMKTEQENTASGIAVGIKRGAEPRTIVIGGHIDSAEPEVPGVDDDGSGTAVVLEASRVLCSSPRQSTLVFCCFGGEEQGLKGSRYFVNHYKDINNIALMLQVDMANGIGTIDIDPETHGISAPRWLVKAAVEEFYSLGYSNLRYPTFFFTLNYSSGSGAGSDHEPFLQKGIPAVDFSTDVSKPIHTPRDCFENFDPRGLKRSGDLVVKLAERFDNGTPDKELESYLLVLIGQQTLFIPQWGQYLFICIAFIFSTLALLMLRKNRIRERRAGMWSIPKIFLFTLIIVLFAWFSSNIVGLLKGIRHPWMAYPDPFYMLALVGGTTGVIASLFLSKTLKITACAYRLYRTAFIILMLFLAGAFLLAPKIAMGPAWALLLLSLSMLVRQVPLRLVFFALSPFWMLRFIFSEWKEMVFRSIARELPDTFMATLFFNSGMVAFFTLYIIAFVFAGAALVRTLPSLKKFLIPLQSGSAVAVSFIIFACSIFALTNVPSYNKLWYRDITAEITSNRTTGESSFTIKSPEYLRGIKVTSGGQTTELSGRTTSAVMPIPATFDTSFVRIERNDTTLSEGDTVRINTSIAIKSKTRPYWVRVTYAPQNKEKEFSITSPHRIFIKENEYRIHWLSFPDTALNVPVRFYAVGSDTVKETITVVFSELPEGVGLNGELCSVKPRMRYVYERNFLLSDKAK